MAGQHRWPPDGGSGPRRGATPIGAILGQSTLLARPSERLGPLEWEQVVGSHLAQRTQPGKVSRGVLEVLVVSSAWAQEVSLLGPTIVQRLQERGRTVRGLRFRVTAIRPLALPQTPVLEVRRAQLPPQVTRALESVDDPLLRQAIAEAVAFNLGRPRR